MTLKVTITAEKSELDVCLKICDYKGVKYIVPGDSCEAWVYNGGSAIVITEEADALH
jgi:hypothetical protein